MAVASPADRPVLRPWIALFFGAIIGRSRRSSARVSPKPLCVSWTSLRRCPVSPWRPPRPSSAHAVQVGSTWGLVVASSSARSPCPHSVKVAHRPRERRGCRGLRSCRDRLGCSRPVGSWSARHAQHGSPRSWSSLTVLVADAIIRGLPDLHRVSLQATTVATWATFRLRLRPNLSVLLGAGGRPSFPACSS